MYVSRLQTHYTDKIQKAMEHNGILLSNMNT